MILARTLTVGLSLSGILVSANVLAQRSPDGGFGGGGVRYTVSRPIEPGPDQLAQQYIKTTKEDEKREVRKKMSDLLGHQFDAHIEEQKKELEDLEKKITELRAWLTKRQDAKAPIVERRIDQLVQDAEGLGWNTPGSPRAYGTPFMIPARALSPQPEKR